MKRCTCLLGNMALAVTLTVVVVSLGLVACQGRDK